VCNNTLALRGQAGINQNSPIPRQIQLIKPGHKGHLSTMDKSKWCS